MFGLVELVLELEIEGVGGSGYHKFFLCLSSSLVNPRLRTKNQLCIIPVPGFG